MSAESWREWFESIAREAGVSRRERIRAEAEWEEWDAPMVAGDTRMIVESFLRKITVTRKWEG